MKLTSTGDISLTNEESIFWTRIHECVYFNMSHFFFVISICNGSLCALPTSIIFDAYLRKNNLYLYLGKTFLWAVVGTKRAQSRATDRDGCVKECHSLCPISEVPRPRKLPIFLETKCADYTDCKVVNHVCKCNSTVSHNHSI